MESFKIENKKKYVKVNPIFLFIVLISLTGLSDFFIIIFFKTIGLIIFTIMWVLILLLSSKEKIID